jgi:hypothetical protein
MSGDELENGIKDDNDGNNGRADIRPRRCRAAW